MEETKSGLRNLPTQVALRNLGPLPQEPHLERKLITDVVKIALIVNRAALRVVVPDHSIQGRPEVMRPSSSRHGDAPMKWLHRAEPDRQARWLRITPRGDRVVYTTGVGDPVRPLVAEIDHQRTRRDA